MEWLAKPSLIIGLGGTGIKSATLIRKDLLEIGENTLPGAVAILGFDTERSNRIKVGGWGKARQTGARSTGPVELAAGEYVYLGGNVRDFAREVKGGKAPHIYKWWRVDQLLEQNVPSNIWDLDEGAGQYRQFGRVALFHNFTAFRTMVERALRDIRRRTNQAGVTIHVMGSLVGGTGAGMFIDIAYLTRILAKTIGLTEAKVFGYFALVDAFLGTPQVNLNRHTQRQDFEARCYAASRELGRLQTTCSPDHPYPMCYEPDSSDKDVLDGRMEQAPYDMIYLFDGHRTVNPLDHVLIEYGIAPTVADVVVTQVDARGGTDITAHIANVPRHRDAQNIDPSVAVVGTVGTYSIVLPIYHWIEGWTHQLGLEVLNSLLQPEEFDSHTGIPIKLYDNRRGGEVSDSGRDAAEQELKQAKDIFTDFMEYIWRVGKRYGEINQRQGVLTELNNFTVEEWLNKMDPDILGLQQLEQAKQRVARVLRADLSVKQVIKGEINEYYVDYNPGGDNQSQASTVREEVRRKTDRLLGSLRDDGRREGGDFRNALQEYRLQHLNRFRTVLAERVQKLLNGTANDPLLQGQSGKLGFTISMIEAIRDHFRAAALALGGMEAGLRSGAQPRPWWMGSQAQNQWVEAERKLNENPNKRNRAAYVKAAQAIVETHKADLARRMAQEIADELVSLVDHLIDTACDWRRALATANEEEGGMYALLLRGNKDNKADLEESKKVKTRWIIEDEEYEGQQYNQYSGTDSKEALSRILKSFSWKVTPAETGKIYLECRFNEEPLRLEKATGPGQRNAEALLKVCREVFSKAWTNMSVTHYLVTKYKDKIDELVSILQKANEPLLQVQDKDKTLPANFLRINPQSRADAEQMPDAKGFTDTVLRRLAAVLGVDTDRVDDEGKEQQFVGDSHSQDRFKLTLLYFQDLNQLPNVTAFSGAAPKYRTFPQNREQLHVLAAEQNAMRYEARVTTILEQRQRELDDRVIMLLEDMDLFRFVARCLVFGEKNYQWGQGEYGLLLYWDIPQRNNPAQQKAWRLTAVPGGKDAHRLPNGTVLHRTTGEQLLPEHWQLTGLVDSPSLLEAIDHFIYRGTDVTNNVRVFKARGDYPRIRESLEWAMERDRERRVNEGRLYWQAPEWMKEERLFQVQGQVALFRTCQHWLKRFVAPKLNEFHNEIHPDGKPRSVSLQREADLWTVLYLVIEEETARLHSQIEEYKGVWLPLPVEKAEPVTIAVPETPSSESHKCPHCDEMHPKEWKVCPKTGKSLEVEVPAEQILCPHCGELHPKVWKACPVTGLELTQSAPVGMVRCPQCGDLHPVEWKVCPITGVSL